MTPNQSQIPTIFQSFTIFLRVPTEFIQCHHTEDLPFAGAISAAARRNGCSEQVSEQFSTQKVQRSDFLCVSTWKTERKRQKLFLRGPIRKFVWDLSAPLVLRRKLKRRTHPIPGGKKTIQVSPVLSVNSISCGVQYTTKCHFVIRERKSHQNTIHLFVDFQTLNN